MSENNNLRSYNQEPHSNGERRHPLRLTRRGRAVVWGASIVLAGSGIGVGVNAITNNAEAAQLRVNDSPVEFQPYTVQKGDTAWKLAQERIRPDQNNAEFHDLVDQIQEEAGGTVDEHESLNLPPVVPRPADQERK